MAVYLVSLSRARNVALACVGVGFVAASLVAAPFHYKLKQQRDEAIEARDYAVYAATLNDRCVSLAEQSAVLLEKQLCDRARGYWSEQQKECSTSSETY